MTQAIGTAGAAGGAASRPLSRRRWGWREWLESLSAVGLGLVMLAAALLYVWQHIHVVRLGYELERLREIQATRVQENKGLRLELGRLRSVRRVEEVARTQLGMVTPKPAQVVVIPEFPVQ